MADNDDTEELVLEEVTRDIHEMAVESGIVERAAELANDPANSPAFERGPVVKHYVRKVYALPEDETDAVKRRIEANINLYHSEFSGMVNVRGVDFSLYNVELIKQAKKDIEISSEEWQIFVQFAELPNYDFDGSTSRIYYFRKYLELADKLIDGSPDFDDTIQPKSTLEVYALLKRMRSVANRGSDSLSAFDYRMFHLGLKIYSTFVRSKKECSDLTLWQYDALLDSALQYAMDVADEKSNTNSEDVSITKKVKLVEKGYDPMDEVQAHLAKMEKREGSTGSVSNA